MKIKGPGPGDRLPRERFIIGPVQECVKSGCRKRIMTRFINAKGLANIDAALPNEGALANAAGPGLKVTWWQRFYPHPGKAL